CFDAVASQFGFEYARRQAALGECLRVVRADGRLAFVMHHAGSVLVRVGRAELDNHARLVAPGGLLDAARDVLPAIASARAGRAVAPGAAGARDAYNRAMAGLAAAVEEAAVPDLLVEARAWVHGLVARADARELPRQLDALAAYRDALDGAALRTREMIEHALDEAAVAAMSEQLEGLRPGWRARREPLAQREGVLAWALHAGPG